MSRETLAEGLGTGLLLYVIVGSGIAAEALTTDPGLALFAHSLAVGLALGALIATLLPVSGAHFNPAVTLALWLGGLMDGAATIRFWLAQTLGAISGVAVANWTFGETALSVSPTVRGGAGLVVAEAVATFVLVLVILGLVRSRRESLVPAAVGAWVAAAVFATSSTGFANPAVTVSRVFTDTYAGIAPGSVPAFLAAQLGAGLAAAAAAGVLFHDTINQPTPT